MSSLIPKQGKFLRSWDSAMCLHYASRVEEALGDLKPVAMSSYYPEVSSANKQLWRDALKALENTLKIADELGISVCEFVAGRLAEQCRPGWSQTCKAVVFDAEHSKDWRVLKKDRLLKALDDLATRIRKWDEDKWDLPTWTRQEWNKLDGGEQRWGRPKWEELEWDESKSRALKQRKRKTDIRLALEMEPGPQFLINNPERVAYILKATKDLRIDRINPGSDTGEDGKYWLCNFNCDVGHVKLYDPQMMPGEFWRRVFSDGKSYGKPSTRVVGFHISDHPYNRLHVDLPPGVYRWNETSVRKLLDDDSVTPGFVPWLNCALCIHEKSHGLAQHRLNVSLELEGETRIKWAKQGLDAVRDGLAELQEERETCDPKWLELRDRFCCNCPEKDP